MSKSGVGRTALYSVLVILAIIGLGIFGVFSFVQNIKVATIHRSGGEDVIVQTPVGRFQMRSHENVDPAALGIPVYPEAKWTKDGGGATFEWTSDDGKGDKALSVLGGEYVTHDSPEQVLSWYRSHLPNWIVITDRHDNNTRFELKEGGYKRMIAIRDKSDGTHIGVATVGEPASN